MRHEVLARKILRRIISEQVDEPADDGSISGDTSFSFDEQDDWSSPTGRKSNAYKMAEESARQNPQGLMERLGSPKMDTPTTGTVKDVENFLRQVTMRHPDLSQVYKTVSASKGYVYIERRKSVDTSGFGSTEKSFMTSNASSARYISLLLVAAGRLGWIKFKPGFDTVMFGGEEKSVIRISLPSYGGASGGANQPAPKVAAPPENKK